MATKKTEVTHESLMETIASCESALSEAQADYKEFCKSNPLEIKPQPTLHELRLLRQKNDKKSDSDHQKANRAAQASAQKAQLKQELRGN